MILYFDASVVLRLVLGEANALADRGRFVGAVASALTEVESLRTIDRLARQGLLSIDDVADRRQAVYQLLEEVELVDISRAVLRRAGEPFSTPLGTLDAIHLATALHWRDATGSDLTMATHDKAIAAAARAAGITVIGG
ncbi:MAG: type II toxin-antitoxin system VapC family toxin [Gemmatimonadales bacterium]|nr:type II toxin-antitoxin system VapC family toxin [Gemmatimonadales bacterium]